MSIRMSNASATATRRSQIVETTIQAIAEFGLARTTFAQIAARGGLSSTRLISYHFDSKTALIEATVSHIYRSIDEFLLDRVRTDPGSRPIRPIGDRPWPPQPPTSASDELRAYVTGTVAYIGTHRTEMRALQSIFASRHSSSYDPAAIQTDPQGDVMRHLREILQRGQDEGNFRDFDTLVIATMIQRPLESLPQLLYDQPDLSPPDYAAELITAIDHAIRRRND